LIAAHTEVGLNIKELVAMRRFANLLIPLRILLSFAASAIMVAQTHSQISSSALSIKSQGMKPFSLSSSRLPLPHGQASVLDSAQVEWLREYSSSALKGHAEGMAVATDPQGNFYVAGKAEGSFSSYDYLTIKYSSSGVELWSARYDGPAHGIDIANAVAVDAAGNVYVTGLSTGLESRYDYATVKYDAAGQQQWVTRYDGLGHAGDVASSIAVDGDGSVYVSGESARAQSGGWSSNYDFATIKYNSFGGEEWVNRYDGRAPYDDKPAGLALDRTGGIYVVGTSCDSIYYDSTSHYGVVYYVCTVMKYASDGDQLWTVKYRPADSVSAFPLDFTVDSSGNIIIVGYTSQALPGPWWNSTTKCMTLKFTASGVLQWSSFYQDPHSQHAGGVRLVTDQAGNVYVAGAIGSRPYNSFVGNDSLFFSKYDQNGQLQWASIITSTAWSNLKPVDVALDPAGSPYVTWLWAQSYYGFDAVYTASYSPNGHEEWRASYDTRFEPPYNNKVTAQAMLSDANGNLHIVGSTGGDQGADILMLKYAPNGIRKWVHTKECNRSWDQVYAMGIDDSNNVYVTGTSNTGAWASDILTIKYSSSGDTQWLARYSGPSESRNVPCALRVDQTGNVYVLATGDSTDSGMGIRRSRFVTIKYNLSGQQQWVAAYRGLGTYDESYAIDAALDDNGNVIVTGYGSASNQREFVTIKYDPTGVQQWVAVFDTANWDEGTTAIAVDDSGAVIVGSTYRIMKYNNAGSLIWVYHQGATAIVVDRLGNIYSTQEEGTTKKLNSAGSVQWSMAFAGNAIALDGSGNVLVRDLSEGVAKISGNGSLLWSLPISDYRIGSFLAVDNGGNVYVAGAHQTSPPQFYSEYQIRALSPSGALLWSTGFEDQGTTSWYHYPIAVSHSGDVFVGAGAQSGSSSVYRTIKYRQVATSVKEEESDMPTGFSLSQNYPNPFNPSTTIRFALPKSGRVELKVYNTLGQEVATLVNEEKVAGTYSAQWNASSVASGVYYYRMQAGEFTATQKMLLMK
jgi:hypothetical protein